jgi:hypothetical protein
MKSIIPTASCLVLLICTFAQTDVAAGLRYQAQHGADPSATIRIVSDRVAGNGDPNSNPRVVTVILPPQYFERDVMPRVVTHLATQYDARWLEMWIYSDQDQLVDPTEADLFRFFEDNDLGARASRPWGLLVYINRKGTVRFRDRGSSSVIEFELLTEVNTLYLGPPN